MHRLFKQLLAGWVVIAFLGNFFYLPLANAQIDLPTAGQMIPLSPSVHPAVLSGIKVFADKPMSFDFVVDQGSKTSSEALAKEDLNRLIRYFMAGLTVPEGDLWVNLSPYEKDRIITDDFGQTEMGRDLLAQDYILKQVTASLIYPEGKTGKEFWAKVYAQAQKKFGNTQIPVNTFNKVWIVPNKATIFEGPVKNGQATAYVTEATLKVMLEEDYLALDKNGQAGDPKAGTPIARSESEDERGAAGTGPASLASQVVREVVIPILEKEINEGSNFAQLRQIYNSLILATWYKKKIKNSILSKQYTNQKKISGIQIDDPKDKDQIYQQYIQAFKKGVYNFVKEEQDPTTSQPIPRKYFSGGAKLRVVLGATNTQPLQHKGDKLAHVDLENQERSPVSLAMAAPTKRMQNLYKKADEHIKNYKLYRRLVKLDVMLFVASGVAGVSFNVIRNDFHIFQEPIFQMSDWWKFHGTDMVRAYVYAVLSKMIYLKMAGKKSGFYAAFSDYTSKKASCIAFAQLLFGAYLYEVGLQKDYMDFMAEVPPMLVHLMLGLKIGSIQNKIIKEGVNENQRNRILRELGKKQSPDGAMSTTLSPEKNQGRFPVSLAMSAKSKEKLRILNALRSAELLEKRLSAAVKLTERSMNYYLSDRLVNALMGVRLMLQTKSEDVAPRTWQGDTRRNIQCIRVFLRVLYDPQFRANWSKWSKTQEFQSAFNFNINEVVNALRKLRNDSKLLRILKPFKDEFEKSAPVIEAIFDNTIQKEPTTEPVAFNNEFPASMLDKFNRLSPAMSVILKEGERLELDGKIIVEGDIIENGEVIKKGKGRIRRATGKSEVIVTPDFNFLAVRHGETYANNDKRPQGRLRFEDPQLNQLTPKGWQQARRAAEEMFKRRDIQEKIKLKEPIVVITSGTKRTQQSSAHFIKLVEEAGGIIEPVAPELRSGAEELHFGEVENVRIADFTDEQQAILARYRNDLDATAKFKPSKDATSESFLDVMIRAKKWIEQLNKKYKGRTVVLFGHGTFLKAVLALLGDPRLLTDVVENGVVERYINRNAFEIPNSSIIELRPKNNVESGFEQSMYKAEFREKRRVLSEHMIAISNIQQTLELVTSFVGDRFHGNKRVDDLKESKSRVFHTISRLRGGITVYKGDIELIKQEILKARRIVELIINEEQEIAQFEAFKIFGSSLDKLEEYLKQIKTDVDVITESVRLEDTIESALRSSRVGGVDIIEDFAPQRGLVRIDERNMEEAFYYIFTYIVDGVKKIAKGAWLKVKTIEDADKITVVISSNGPAIDPLKLKELFNGGSLDLQIAKQVIEDNRSTIQVESSAKKGMVVTVIVPKDRAMVNNVARIYRNHKHELNNHMTSIILLNEMLYSEIGDRFRFVYDGIRQEAKVMRDLQSPSYEDFKAMRVRMRVLSKQIDIIGMDPKVSNVELFSLYVDDIRRIGLYLDEIHENEDYFKTLNLDLVALKPLIETGVRDMAVSNADVKISLDINESETNLVEVDVIKFQEVIINLVKNAVFALEKRKDGKVGGVIQISARAKDGKVEIAIVDNRPGIPADILPRIFEEGFTTKGSEGSGLGLNIVREIIEAHGGSIAASSVFGEGATFRISLPMVHPSSAAMSATGGIDLNNLKDAIKVDGIEAFNFTPKSLIGLRINGLTPVVTGIEDLKSLPEFLNI